MATVKGRTEVRRFLEQLPDQLATKALVGAGRKAGEVVCEDAKARSVSRGVADALVVRVRNRDGRIVVKVTIPPGWERTLGIWQEYGTTGHFIRVDDQQRDGRSVARINKLDREAAKNGEAGPGQAMVIGGNFVTGTVWHPGAKRHEFLRVALDTKESEAIAAAQNYINARLTKAGIVGNDEPEDIE